MTSISENSDTNVSHDNKQPDSLSSNKNLERLEKVPPPDCLYGWVVVCAVFFVVFFVFGMALSYGVYQDLYANDIFRGESLLKITYIGSVANGTMFLFGPISGVLLAYVGHRGMMLMACVLSPLGFLLASFSTEIWQLYLTQGLIVGAGSGCAFFGSISLTALWFEKYRGLATGIAISGSGFGGLALAPLIRLLIDRVGYRWSLRVLAFIGMGCYAFAAAFLRPRIRRPSPRKIRLLDFSVLNKKLSVLVLVGSFAMLGYWQPFFMIPGYAISETGISSTTAAVLVGVMSGVNSVARIVLGGIADIYGRVNILFLSVLVSGLSILLLWVFANYFGVLVLFIIFYGASSGGFISLFPVIVAELAKPEDIPVAIGFAFFAFAVGSFLGPGFTILLRSAGGNLAGIIFAGCVTLVAALFSVWLRYLLDKRIFAKVPFTRANRREACMGFIRFKILHSCIISATLSYENAYSG
ncbi:uncharacterized protein VTP21DRAFT_9923 [Calcarisporiella thermophila]|uniref:uncharacterized protein n=1 Tax=Calcarisporiella thermophila TaxID=911321 RepID=UPI00374424C5